MNILNLLLFAPKLGDKKGVKLGLTKENKRDGVFDSVLLKSLKGKDNETFHLSKIHLPSLKDPIRGHFPFLLIYPSIEKGQIIGKSAHRSEEQLKGEISAFSFLDLKEIRSLKPLSKLRGVLKRRGSVSIPKVERELLYKPLKKLSLKGFKLKTIKKEGERLFKLDKEQVAHGGVPLKTGFFFGVAPVHLHIKNVGVKGKSSNQDERKRVIVKAVLKGSGVSKGKVSLKNIKQVLSKGLDPSLRTSKREKSEHNLSENREFNEVEFLRKDESSANTKKNFPNGKRIMASNSDYNLREEIEKTNGFNRETTLTEKTSVSFLSSNSPINLGERFRASADFYFQTLTVGSSLQLLPLKEYGLNRKFFHFSSKFDKKSKIIKGVSASFSPDKFPAPKRAEVDRSSPFPVHLFSSAVGNPPSLLSDNFPQFQHQHHSKLNTAYSDVPFTGSSTVFLPDISNGSAEGEHSFLEASDHSSRFHPFKEDTGFQVSYVDKNLKLLATLRGKVLNLNLNLLADWHLDPSTLKDLTAVIEDSGFVTGKITLKQKKGRYTLFHEKASGELELKV